MYLYKDGNTPRVYNVQYGLINDDFVIHSPCTTESRSAALSGRHSVLFLSNSNVDLTGKPNSFNSNNCYNPLSFSVSTILNFSTLSCDFNKFDNDSSFTF